MRIALDGIAVIAIQRGVDFSGLLKGRFVDFIRLYFRTKFLKTVKETVRKYVRTKTHDAIYKINPDHIE